MIQMSWPELWNANWSLQRTKCSPGSESVFTHRDAALVIILLVGTGTDLRLIWCNIPAQSRPNQRIKGALTRACLKGALVPSSTQLFTSFTSPTRLRDDPKTIRPAISSMLQNSLMCSICSLTSIEIFTLPPSPDQVSRTLGLLGFNTDGTAAFRIPKKKKKRSQIWLEIVCSLSCGFSGSVFKDILAAFLSYFSISVLVYWYTQRYFIWFHSCLSGNRVCIMYLGISLYVRMFQVCVSVSAWVCVLSSLALSPSFLKFVSAVCC